MTAILKFQTAKTYSLMVAKVQELKTLALYLETLIMLVLMVHIVMAAQWY